jgi:hypothetical protein
MARTYSLWEAQLPVPTEPLVREAATGQRLSGFGGGLNYLIYNGAVSGPAIVSIAPTDRSLDFEGCGNWAALPTTRERHVFSGRAHGLSISRSLREPTRLVAALRVTGRASVPLASPASQA